MKRSNKKGFTIVELVIVIAVIAILAGVLIPTFAGVVQKAKISNDTQLVRNLNTALALEEKPDTMHEALAIVEEAGYSVEKINATATDNEILWDSENNLFCYLNGGKAEYIPNSNPKAVDDVDLWVIADSLPATQKYSIYASEKWTAAEVAVTVGFDAGENTNITKVTYTGSNEVIIRTNSGLTDLFVNAGTVNHYGIGKQLTVDTAATYNEFGSFGFSANDGTVAGNETEATAAGYTYVSTAEELTTALNESKAKIALGADIAVEHTLGAVDYNYFIVQSDLELNLNGYTLSAFTKSTYGVNHNSATLYVNRGAKLSVTGQGSVTIETDYDMAWNSFTAVIAGRGDVVIDGAVTIANLGGTAMSYAIDMHSWGANAQSYLTIEAGNIYSAQYRAIRLNKQSPTASSDMTEIFNLTINGGLVSGATGAVFAHDGSEAADGIYNITLNGGTLSTAAGNAIRSWGWDTETINFTVNGGKVLSAGIDVTESFN